METGGLFHVGQKRREYEPGTGIPQGGERESGVWWTAQTSMTSHGGYGCLV